MDQDQGILQQLQSQAEQERTPSVPVWAEGLNETKQYEKDALQGAGGLLSGGAVEKGFRLLSKSPKGMSALKKLGMTDEDAETIITAIKSRDSGSLTDFLARKGTGFIEKTASKLGIKGGRVAQTTSKALKEGRVPSRQELHKGGSDEDSLLDSLQSKASGAIRNVSSRVESEVGENLKRVTQTLNDIKGKAQSKFGDANQAFQDAQNDLGTTDDDLLASLQKKFKTDAPSTDLGEPVEINPATNEEIDPLKKAQDANDALDQELENIKSQPVEEDPYSSAWTKDKMEQERFKNLNESPPQTAEESIEPVPREPLMKTDESDPDLKDFDDDEITPKIPPSEQTQGIDPASLSDDAGFQRGSQLIKAKREVIRKFALSSPDNLNA